MSHILNWLHQAAVLESDIGGYKLLGKKSHYVYVQSCVYIYIIYQVFQRRLAKTKISKISVFEVKRSFSWDRITRGAEFSRDCITRGGGCQKCVILTN